MNPRLMKGVLGCLFILTFLACDNSGEDIHCTKKYDQTALLVNTIDQLIIPAFDQLSIATQTLEDNAADFQRGPSILSLENLCEEFVKTYLDFQACAQYNFGPSELVFFREVFNNFPLNQQEFNDLLEADTPDFTNPNTYDKGFPALDFLLFSGGADLTTTLNDLTSDPDKISFLVSMITFMHSSAEDLSGSWKQYRDDFIALQGMDAGSSLSMIVNGLNQNYEISKRDRLGIPSGELTLNFPNPDKVEAPYSKISLDLLKASIKASEDLYRGRSHISGVDGEGLDDVIEFVGAMKLDQSLNQVILDQYEELTFFLSEIEGPLSEACVERTQQVVDAYYSSSRQVVNTKTDISSVLCITITYVDAPSDTD